MRKTIYIAIVGLIPTFAMAQNSPPSQSRIEFLQRQAMDPRRNEPDFLIKEAQAQKWYQEAEERKKKRDLELGIQLKKDNAILESKCDSIDTHEMAKVFEKNLFMVERNAKVLEFTKGYRIGVCFGEVLTDLAGKYSLTFNFLVVNGHDYVEMDIVR